MLDRGLLWLDEAEPILNVERSNSDLSQRLERSFSSPLLSDSLSIGPALRNRIRQRTAVHYEQRRINPPAPSVLHSYSARTAREETDLLYHPVGLLKFPPPTGLLV